MPSDHAAAISVASDGDGAPSPTPTVSPSPPPAVPATPVPGTAARGSAQWWTPRRGGHRRRPRRQRGPPMGPRRPMTPPRSRGPPRGTRAPARTPSPAPIAIAPPFHSPGLGGDLFPLVSAPTVCLSRSSGTLGDCLSPTLSSCSHGSPCLRQARGPRGPAGADGGVSAAPPPPPRRRARRPAGARGAREPRPPRPLPAPGRPRGGPGGDRCIAAAAVTSSPCPRRRPLHTHHDAGHNAHPQCTPMVLRPVDMGYTPSPNPQARHIGPRVSEWFLCPMFYQRERILFPFQHLF